MSFLRRRAAGFPPRASFPAPPLTAHIVITCWGSHGDTDPYLGLAAGLTARGHRVTMATLEHYRSVVTGAGHGFVPIRPAADPGDRALVERIMDRDRGTQFLLCDVMMPGLQAMYDDLGPVVREADVVISHPLTMAAPMHAEQQGIPWASTVLAPTSFFSAHDMPVFPPAPWLKHAERLGVWAGRLLTRMAKGVSARWVEPVRAMRRSLSLPDVGNPLFEGQHSPHLVLALYSRVLGKPQPDWPPGVVVTGHMFHDAPHGRTLDPALDEFVAGGPPPIVFTLGSSAVHVAGDFWRTSAAAVEALGARAIFLVGPGRSDAIRGQVPTSIFVADGAPHSLVMPRSAAVVQQCGIGTLAQGLRAGRPMLCVPWAHDQPDNAWRAAALGMAEIVPARDYRVPRVTRALSALLSEARYREAAERVAAQVRAERGVEAACDAIERVFSLRA